jgi:uncharacterized membrane protein (UPF0127 family)
VTLRVGGGAVLCERCVVADSMVRRMRGLLGRRELPPGEGILLWPASSVHSWFMRFAFDAVFVDRDFTVLRIAADVKPWRARSHRGAHAVVELPAGECEQRGLAVGARLAAEPSL